MTLDTAAMERLAHLTHLARTELAMMSFPSKPWVIPRLRDGEPMLDVAIVGAGQSGLGVGLMLKRRGIGNILLIDRNPVGYEGVWDTYARNHEIRSPKQVMGMDLGIPSLSIQRFFEARHGEGSWDSIKRVPRQDWMDYLRWYRALAELPIVNDTAVTDIQYDADGVHLTLSDYTVRHARFLVLATGIEGGGVWQVPKSVSDALPADRYNHSSDVLDFSGLAGQRVGVLGGGASAFDVAVTALKAGASRVDMFLRRSTLPMIDAQRELETTALMDHTHELADDTKWALASFMGGLSQCPAEHHFNVAFEYPNFGMHLSSPWTGIAMDGDEIHITTPKAEFRLDHVFAATGVALDLARRPELARIAQHAATWRDRFVPPDGDVNHPRLSFPYLDRCYRFTEKIAGSSPGLDRIFCFNGAAYLSMGGMASASISSFKFGGARLTRRITGAIFAEQEDQIVPSIAAFRTPGIKIAPHIRAALGMEPEPDEATAASA